jgi:hypothetical protein
VRYIKICYIFNSKIKKLNIDNLIRKLKRHYNNLSYFLDVSYERINKETVNEPIDRDLTPFPPDKYDIELDLFKIVIFDPQQLVQSSEYIISTKLLDSEKNWVPADHFIGELPPVDLNEPSQRIDVFSR